MRCNFILLAALVILSMEVPSHFSVSFPQITYSELIRPYCNATSILEAFLHDVTSFHSCAPAELTRDAIHSKTSTNSENAKSMSCAGCATTKYSMDIARVAIFVLDGLYMLELLMLLFAILALLLQNLYVEAQWKEWKRHAPFSANGWCMLTKLWKFRRTPPQEYLLKEGGIISYRYLRPDTSLNIYLLKEAFEELERHPGVLEDPNFYEFATAFMLTPVPRAAFMKIPDDRKFDWLNKRYQDDILIGWEWLEILS